MKKLLALLLFPAAALAQAPQAFTLKGKIAMDKPLDWVYINYRNGEVMVKDSIRPYNGRFTYKGKIEEPTLATLRLAYLPTAGGEKPKGEMVQLFLEGGKIRLAVKDTITNLIVKGSKAHTDFATLKQWEKPYGETLRQLYAEWSGYGKDLNKEAQKGVEARIDSVDGVLKEKVYRSFVTANPQSPVALFAVKQYAGYDLDADQVEPLFAVLPVATQQWPSAMEFKEQIETAKKTGIGRHAMDFTQNDTLGKPVSLSSFKGQYVLVDFWASWCGPCRAENPNVVKVFKAYKDKGFTVLGVSLDRPNAKDKWLKAIHDDNLTWTHVSDLKFWDNEVARLYGIRAIPQNLLIDPQGKIVAKNIRGEALGQAVEKAISEAAF